MVTKTNHDRINELIEQTEDPAQRATLIVLANIDHALDANTAATERIAMAFETHREEFATHRKEFALHVTSEDKMFATARGAQWAGVILIGGLQLSVAAIIGLVIFTYNRSNDAQEAQIAVNTKRLYNVEARLEALATVIQRHDEREAAPRGERGATP